MLKTFAAVTVAAGALTAGFAVPALAGGTTAGPATAGHWQTMKLPGVGPWSEVSDVTAAGGVEWAVASAYDNLGETVWKNSGSGWSPTALPLPKGYGGSNLRAGSAADAWAFSLDYDSIDYSGGFDVLHWNGGSWSADGHIPNLSGAGRVTSAIVFGPADVWAFTNGDGGDMKDGTAWHWNGRAWSQSTAPGAGLSCGSGVSGSSIWACDGTSVAHWNGTSWTATSVAGLLPSDNNFQRVNAVVAEAPDNVYAIGDANGQNYSGPLVLLHWNGRTWTKIASYGGGDVVPDGVASDGHGGLWLAVTGDPGTLLHWSGGQLTRIGLPIPASIVNLASVTRTSAGTLLIGGYIHPAGQPSGRGTPVLFTYTP
jgi:hypothetical protein